jgi:hypothetical protein
MKTATIEEVNEQLQRAYVFKAIVLISSNQTDPEGLLNMCVGTIHPNYKIIGGSKIIIDARGNRLLLTPQKQLILCTSKDLSTDTVNALIEEQEIENDCLIISKYKGQIN